MTPIDPTVAALAWLLAFILRGTVGEKWPKTRHLLPILAMLAAVFLYAVADVVKGEPLTWHVALRGILAGSTAVTTHSAWRELAKFVESRAAKPPETPALPKEDPGTPPGEAA